MRLPRGGGGVLTACRCVPVLRLASTAGRARAVPLWHLTVGWCALAAGPDCVCARGLEGSAAV